MLLKVVVFWVQLLILLRAANFSEEKSMNYSSMPNKLAEHSRVSPQNAYKSLTNGLENNWTFTVRITPYSDSVLREVEKTVDKNLISLLSQRRTLLSQRELFNRAFNLHCPKRQSYARQKQCDA